MFSVIGFDKNSPYEIPKNSDLEIKTNEISVGESINKILEILKEKYGVKL